MSQNFKLRYSAGILLPLILSACDGGGVEITQGGSENAFSGLNDLAFSSVELTGRVADGYIQGEGGVYNLTVPEEYEDKPIVADIPPEAIDEDTGEPIGESLIFVAPAGKPDFLSPLTTLVHHELETNPSLNVDEAEEAVKGVLGIDDASISLFADYVAMSNSETSTESEQEQFQYLHDTARVVVSSMIGLESQVNAAVGIDGSDIEGQSDLDRAIQGVVRNEVSELLPEIAYLVAEMIANGSEELEAIESDGSIAEAGDSDELLVVDEVDTVEDFDPLEIASEVVPDLSPEDLTEQVEAGIEQTDIAETDLEQVLADGVYWLDFDCGNGSTTSAFAGTDQVGSDCDISYSLTQTDGTGSNVATESFRFDPSIGAWMYTDHQLDAKVNDYSLINGEWLQVSTKGPEGEIEFVSSNSAMVSSDTGTTLIDSVSQSLEANDVTDHLWTAEPDSIWHELADSTDIFAGGAELHQLTLREYGSPYALFMEPALESECEIYNGNCNVIELVEDDLSSAVTSLESVLDASVVGAQIATNSENFPGLTLELVADESAEGGVPTQGIARFDFGAEEAPVSVPGGDSTEDDSSATSETPAVAAASNSAEAYLQCIEDWENNIVVGDQPTTLPTSFFAPGDFAGTPDELVELLNEGVNPAEEIEESVSADPFNVLAEEEQHNCDELLISASDVASETDAASDDEIELVELVEAAESVESSASVLETIWQLINVDGVDMIEIQMPNVLLSGDAATTGGSILLTEHNDFVRLGSSVETTKIKQRFTYNENAFTTMRSIIESKLTDE